MFIFNEFSNHYRPIIEKALQDYLTFNIKDHRNRLESSMLYSTTCGKSKRIRPLLTIASFKCFSSSINKILPLACAFELIHTYSLIHDDLPAMDDDDLRRGQPTNHKQYDEATAILAGDTLNTFAFEILATELPKYYDPYICLKVISKFAQSCGIQGMSGGQMLDLIENEPKEENHLIQTHQLKTGALIESTLVLPAILEEAAVNDIAQFQKLGSLCGLLFQITDDILDVTATSKEIGKTPNKDISQDKLTYVSFYGLDGAKQQATETAEAALVICDRLSEKMNTELLRDIVHFILNRTT